jgi:hypothetical protein
MSISVNGAGYGTATGGPVQINVSGHPELSGGYDVKTAADLGIGAKVNADGYIVMDNRLLKNVELFIAQIGGKPRIVAAKPFIRAEANQALPVRSESSGIQQETSEKSGKTDSACADKCTSQYNKGEFKAGITIEDCIKETCK